jgi:putative peptidoglycan lipid II flippase
MALRVPIVRLLFERGRFSALDTERTAEALLLFCTGLVAYTGVKVLAPAFYALGTPRVPLAASASAVATNLVLVLTLHQRIGFRAMALGTAAGALVNMGVLGVVFTRRVGSLWRGGLASSLVRATVASLAMAGVVWTAARLLEARLGVGGLRAQALSALVPVVLGVLAYLGMAAFLRAPELGPLAVALRGRFGRKRPAL